MVPSVNKLQVVFFKIDNHNLVLKTIFAVLLELPKFQLLVTERIDKEESNTSSSTIIAIVTSSFLAVVILVLVVLLVLRRRRVEVGEVGSNDLYGTYEDGVLYNTVEDANTYYGEEEGMEERRNKATDWNSQYGN